MTKRPPAPTMADLVAAALRVPEVRLVELPAGASRGAYRVERPDGEPLAFLRTQAGGEGGLSTNLGLAGEAEILRRAHALGFPVPEVYATITDPAAVVMELAKGTSRPEPEEAEAVGPEFMGHIARLHTVAPADLGMEGPATVSAAVRADLEDWRRESYGQPGGPSLTVRLGLRVLAATLPESDEPPRALHGDVGVGNFMVHEGKVSALLDWELAHAGDIHEDLAWLWVRGAHSSFGDPKTRIAEYEQAAGRQVDWRRLDWHVALVTLKSLIGLQWRLNAEGDDPGLLVVHIANLTYEALLGAALARLVGASVELLTEQPEAHTDVPARLLDRLAAASGGLSREGEIVLAHLRDRARHAVWEQRRLREDARAELGVEPADLTDLVERAGPADFAALVRVVGRAADRACRSMPNAERRVRRAMAIGLGV